MMSSTKAIPFRLTVDQTLIKDLKQRLSNVLGYDHCGAQGGNWGAFVTSRLGYGYPQNVTAIHLNMLAVDHDPKIFENPTPEEQKIIEVVKDVPRLEVNQPEVVFVKRDTENAPDTA